MGNQKIAACLTLKAMPTYPIPWGGYKRKDNLNPTYYQLVDAIEGKAPLKITPGQTLRVMKVMEASFASSETGEAIKTNI